MSTEKVTPVNLQSDILSDNMRVEDLMVIIDQLKSDISNKPTTQISISGSSNSYDDINHENILKLMGKVECYLQDIIDTMRNSLRNISKKSLKAYSEIPKAKWLVMDPAMVTLLINNC